MSRAPFGVVNTQVVYEGYMQMLSWLQGMKEPISQLMHGPRQESGDETNDCCKEPSSSYFDNEPWDVIDWKTACKDDDSGSKTLARISSLGEKKGGFQGYEMEQLPCHASILRPWQQSLVNIECSAPGTTKFIRHVACPYYQSGKTWLSLYLVQTNRGTFVQVTPEMRLLELSKLVYETMVSRSKKIVRGVVCFDVQDQVDEEVLMHVFLIAKKITMGKVEYATPQGKRCYKFEPVSVWILGNTMLSKKQLDGLAQEYKIGKSLRKSMVDENFCLASLNT